MTKGIVDRINNRVYRGRTDRESHRLAIQNKPADKSEVLSGIAATTDKLNERRVTAFFRFFAIQVAKRGEQLLFGKAIWIYIVQVLM
jgi:hypothetical protein